MGNTNGFYKYENGELFYAPTFVECKEYKLVVEEKDTYNLPIDGCFFFESEIKAKDFFGIVDGINNKI